MSYNEVVAKLESSVVKSGRSPSEVTLVVVSKGRSPSEIADLYGMGHRDFGENRAREMAEKAARLPDDIRWHFVGALQTNKARVVRPITTLLHSLDRVSLAEAWVKGPGHPPATLAQVNIGAEDQKSGVRPDEVMTLVEAFLDLGIVVAGLMAIPPVAANPEAVRPYFRALREIRDEVGATHRGVTHLSMGMTDDYEVAVEEGATIIRVGRAIFGPSD